MRAVEILDRLDVLGQALGREGVAHVHRQSVGAELGLAAAASVQGPQPGGDVRRAEQLVAGELDRADLVLRAFVDDEPDDHGPGRRIDELHVLDLEINVALVAVKLGQLLLVLLELLVLETPLPVIQENIQCLRVLMALRSFFSGKAFAPTKSTSMILTFGLSVISNVAVPRPAFSSMFSTYLTSVCG